MRDEIFDADALRLEGSRRIATTSLLIPGKGQQ